MYEDRLYQKGYSTPWLKCITKRILELDIYEIHSGICGAHAGSRAITHIHSNVPTLPHIELTTITSP